MMSLQNFFVGAAVIKVDIPIIIAMLIISIIKITIIIIINFIMSTMLIISISNIMLMKVGFLAYAGYKIAVCNCSGWVGIFSISSHYFYFCDTILFEPLSCLTAHRPLPCPCRPFFFNWDRQVCTSPLFSSFLNFLIFIYSRDLLLLHIKPSSLFLHRRRC